PHIGVFVLTIISAIVGAYGVLNVNNLTQVTLISNIGTFLLYGMTCVICIVAFIGSVGRNLFTTVIAPTLGGLLNSAMLVGVIYYALTAGGASQLNAIIAVCFCLGWLAIGCGYLYTRKIIHGIPILHAHDHKRRVQQAAHVVAATGD
ncbi:MAG: APC family permease, partial [Ktedonobacteraceae bacterium]